MATNVNGPASMSLKRRLRPLAYNLARWVGPIAWCEGRMCEAMTILTYHRVLPDEQCASYPFPSLAIPASAFARQIEWLARHYQLCTVSDGIQSLDAGAHPTSPLVAVTFDDGYADNYDLAAPILDSHGAKATFFVTTDFVTGGILWFDCAAAHWERCGASAIAEATNQVVGGGQVGTWRSLAEWIHFLKMSPPDVRIAILSRLGRPSVCVPTAISVLQLKDLFARGHEIGSHTIHHPLLPQLSDEDLALELTGSKQFIEKTLGSTISGFCYTNGDHDARVIEAVRAAGYRYACTVNPGLNRASTRRFELRRRDINPARVLSRNVHDPLAFRAEVCGLRHG